MWKLKRISERTVQVETVRGHVDYAIRYDNGQIAYDWPERVPKYLKRKVAREFEKPFGGNHA